MFELKDLDSLIQTMLDDGNDPETIARVLEIPVSWVFVELPIEREDSANWYNPQPQFDW